MLNCIEELYARSVFHRDIKPQNFLVNSTNLVVSDFGLSTEMGSSTLFTQSSVFWGTQGYIPPEFHTEGGFKNADASGDIFMLGKTFYHLISGTNPTYMIQGAIPTPLWAVLEHCCNPIKAYRYQNLQSLRHALTAAYDVILQRIVGSAPSFIFLKTITESIESTASCRLPDVIQLIDSMSMLEDDVKSELCLKLPNQLFPLLGLQEIQDRLSTFLSCYKVMVEKGDYGFSYAERIALNMEVLFKSAAVSPVNKAQALGIAIDAAYAQNRFSAMDTCREMIRSVVDEDLAAYVSNVISDHSDTFIAAVPYAEYKAVAIRSVLAQLQN